MLSAVSSGGNGIYENLSNYFLGGATRARPAPGGVPGSRAPSARQNTRPGQQPPAGKTPIPVSSQKPGNREGNQRIPYARMMFTDQDDAAKPRELYTGDVVFVHKTSTAMGQSTNRCIKCTGLSQLNAILGFPGDTSKPVMEDRMAPGVTTLDYSDPLFAARVQQVRLVRAKDEIAAIGAAIEHEKARGTLDTDPRMLALIASLAVPNAEAAAAEAGPPAANDFKPRVDWPAARMLSDWTLDGVIINVDDEVELDDTNQPQLSRDDGVLMNVCVQGPTPLRNTAWQLENSMEAHMWNPQFIDPRLLVLDKVFVGLVAFKDTTKLRVTFHYKLFSGRQALAVRNNVGTESGDKFKHGPDEEELVNLVGAWRVGTILDNRLTTDQNHHAQINVVVEWWDVARLQAEFGEAIGSEHA